jgi:hypothetical protein
MFKCCYLLRIVERGVVRQKVGGDRWENTAAMRILPIFLIFFVFFVEIPLSESCEGFNVGRMRY